MHPHPPANTNALPPSLTALLMGVQAGQRQADVRAPGRSDTWRWETGLTLPERQLAASRGAPEGSPLARVRELHRAGLWVAYHAGFAGGLARALLEGPSADSPTPELAESYGAYVAHRMVYEGDWDDETTREEMLRYVLTRTALRDEAMVRIQGLGLVGSFLQGVALAVPEAVDLHLRLRGRRRRGPAGEGRAKPARGARKRADTGVRLRVVKNPGEEQRPELRRTSDPRTGLTVVALPASYPHAKLRVFLGSGAAIAKFLRAFGMYAAAARCRNAERAAYLSTIHVARPARVTAPMLAPWLFRVLVRTLVEDRVDLVVASADVSDRRERHDALRMLEASGFVVDEGEGTGEGAFASLDLRRLRADAV
jgi:hypothetical protein